MSNKSLCFLDKDRQCPTGEFSQEALCKAWDEALNECVLLHTVRLMASKKDSYTIYPKSAPPPEVK